MSSLALSKSFGHIPGVPLFARFKSRDELMKAGLHGQKQAGIHGDSKEGAYSICISQGYEDNVDRGNTITYVGSGGQDSRGEQIDDQSLDDPRNKALKISSETRTPVRVIRGKNTSSHYAPTSGYRYDGLYVVDSAVERAGKQGRIMCFFELRRLTDPGDPPIPSHRLLNQKRLAAMNRKVKLQRR